MAIALVQSGEKKLRRKLAKLESHANCDDEVKRIKNDLATLEMQVRNLAACRLVG